MTLTLFRSILALLRPGAPGGNGHREPRVQDMGEDDILFREQVKAFRAKLEYRAVALGQKVVAVTSAISGEGKTLLTGKLAASLASSGRKRVLLVGIDLRKADLAAALDVGPHPGLAEYLAGSAGESSIERTTEVPGLVVVPAGLRIADPTDMIAGNRLREYLARARDRFDLVLLDTPPVLPVADTLLLRDQVDSFLLVYRANWTPHDLFRKAIEELGESRILGVVLNGVEQRKQRHYEKYYGNYYRKTGVPDSP